MAVPPPCDTLETNPPLSSYDVLLCGWQQFREYWAGTPPALFGYPSDVPVTCASYHELEQYAEWFTLFGQVMHDRRPDCPPHDCLMLLGARPEAQGWGLGCALLRHRLASLDLVGVSTYLVTTTRHFEQGVYSRAGCWPLGAPSQFPEGLEVYPLWRDPRPGIAVA